MTAPERVIASLREHEGFRALVYDDATGQPIGPGSVVQGNPTIGYGWALNKLPMSTSQAEAHLRETVQEVIFELHHRLPWITEVDPARQAVLYELGYNLGVGGLLGFVKMLDALRRRRYDVAAAELLDSKWRTDVGPRRASALAKRLRDGQEG
jgi:lysozyme